MKFNERLLTKFRQSLGNQYGTRNKESSWDLQQWEAITTYGSERAKVRNKDQRTEISERRELWRSQLMFGRLSPMRYLLYLSTKKEAVNPQGRRLPGQRATAEGLRLSTKTMEARRLWNNNFQVLKESS